jgi:hypothetical protein
LEIEHQEATDDETSWEGEAMRRRLVRVLFVVALGTALATAVGVSAAVAQEPPTATARLTGTATLVAKGAAVDVDVAYSCSPDTTGGNVQLGLTQRVSGGLVASGFGFTNILVCDGAEHTTTMRVTARSPEGGGPGRAFKKGDAVAEGAFSACNEFGCRDQALSATVRVR